MYFLLKTAFWISLVLLILPIGIGENEEAPSINPVQAFVAAQSTVSDLSGFCERNPAACETGSSIASLVALKAKQAARLAITYLADEEEDSSVQTIAAHDLPGAVEPEIVDGSPLPQMEAQPVQIASGTLTASDIEIPWSLSSNGAISTTQSSLPYLDGQPVYQSASIPTPVPRPIPRS